MTPLRTPSLRRPATVRRRGFNLIELLVALGISAALLTATMVSLNACFIAYQTTTEEASTHAVSRLIMHRVLAMVRTGDGFGPLPEDALEEVVESDYFEFTDHQGQLIRITFNEDDGQLLYRVGADGEDRVLLAGVQRTVTGEGAEAVEFPAFILEYEKGTHLRRFSMDLTIMPDATQSTKFDMGIMRPIRMVASSMPRTETW